MKKLSLLLCMILLAMSIMPVGVSAASWYINENAPVAVPDAKPTIDGTISADEGWSAKALMNEDTASSFWGENPLTSSTELYFAASNDGLYVAADVSDVGAAYVVKFYNEDGSRKHYATYIDENAGTYAREDGKYPSVTPDGYELLYHRTVEKEDSAPEGVIPVCSFWNTFSGNTFIYSTGEDTVDTQAGWNGDVIGIALDPLKAFIEDQFMESDDITPFYNFGLFEDGSVKVYRTDCENQGEVTEECQTAGQVTDDGFCFEALIPWDLIVDDANAAGAVMGLSTEITKEDCIAAAAEHKIGVRYMDRWNNPETGAVDTWSRFFLICNECADGSKAYEGSGANLKSYGLTLVMDGVAEDTTPPDTTDTAAPDTTDTAAPESTDTAAPGTTKAPDTTKAPTATKAPTTNKNTTTSNNNNSAAQTFDAGIAVTLGALATSALGVVYSKKRK